MVLVGGLMVLFSYALMTVAGNTAIFVGEKYTSEQKAMWAGFSAMEKAMQEYKNGNFSFTEQVIFRTNGAEALLTFDKEAGVPYSTNNFSESTATVGWNNTLVPKNSVHLVTVCHHGLGHVVYEKIVKNHSFPWSVASNGSITGNDMEVFSIREAEYIFNGISEEEKEEASVLSNSPSGGTPGSPFSILLTGNSVVTGTAQTVGQVSAMAPSEVKGAVNEGVQYKQEITIPKVAVDYKPDPADTRVYGPGVTKISGKFEAPDGVVIGDVEFDDGYIYVKGSATVTGKISGYGAIVAERDIIVTGSMNTHADLAALVAGRNIEITGSGAETSSFQGLILAEGSFKARDTTLVGSAITLDKNGSVELERVRAVNAKDLTQIDITYAVELKKAVSPNVSGDSNLGNNEQIGIKYKDDFVAFTPDNYDRLELLALTIIRENDGPGKIIVRKTHPDGSTSDSTQPSSTMQNNFILAYNAWNAYEDQVETDTVVTENIFQLDFNKFLRVSGTFQVVVQGIKPIAAETGRELLGD